MTREMDKAVGVQLQSPRVYAGLDTACAANRLALEAEELETYEAGAPTSPAQCLVGDGGVLRGAAVSDVCAPGGVTQHIDRVDQGFCAAKFAVPVDGIKLR